MHHSGGIMIRLEVVNEIYNEIRIDLVLQELSNFP